VGEIDIALSRPLAVDPYAVNSRTGRIVLDMKGRISGGGLVLSLMSRRKPARASLMRAVQIRRVGAGAGRAVRSRGAIVWLTGAEGSGTSKLARAIERRLFERGGTPIVLEGSALRSGLNADLGDTPADHTETIRRTAEVAVHLAQSGFIAIVTAVSPSAAGRARARAIGGKRFMKFMSTRRPSRAHSSRRPTKRRMLRISGSMRTATISKPIRSRSSSCSRPPA